MGVIVEFFIIIAGIVGVVAVIFNGAMKSSKEALEAGEKARAKREFTEKFIDEELEKQIVDRINDCYETDAIYEELKEDLTEVYGEGYRSRFIIIPDTSPYEFMKRESYWNEWAKYLLLSKQGKFPEQRFISLGNPVSAPTNYHLCQIIQRNIREFDPSFSLCRSCTEATANQLVTSLAGRNVIPECDFNPPFKMNDISIYRL